MLFLRERKKTTDFPDPKFFIGLCFLQSFLSAEINFYKTFPLRTLPSTKDNAETRYVLGVELNFADKINKTNITLCPENKKAPVVDSTESMKETR